VSTDVFRIIISKPFELYCFYYAIHDQELLCKIHGNQKMTIQSIFFVKIKYFANLRPARKFLQTIKRQLHPACAHDGVLFYDSASAKLISIDYIVSLFLVQPSPFFFFFLFTKFIFQKIVYLYCFFLTPLIYKL
jgi:hypothetical protein